MQQTLQKYGSKNVPYSKSIRDLSHGTEDSCQHALSTENDLYIISITVTFENETELLTIELEYHTIITIYDPSQNIV